LQNGKLQHARLDSRCWTVVALQSSAILEKGIYNEQ